MIRWEAAKRPPADAETPFASAVVRGKRMQPDLVTWEFLVEYSPEEGSEEEGGLQTFVEWLPEQALPLWLIKTYEEKYRRDGVVPVRGRGAAAAAAVADACGMCAAVYADDKDSLWVACDTCNKWFHCACLGIEQVVQNYCCGLPVGDTFFPHRFWCRRCSRRWVMSPTTALSVWSSSRHVAGMSSSGQAAGGDVPAVKLPRMWPWLCTRCNHHSVCIVVCTLCVICQHTRCPM